MNTITKIGGLPVRARLVKTDSWEVRRRDENGHIYFSAKRSTVGQSFEIGQTIVRDRFLAISTPGEALEFCQKHGPFQRAPGFDAYSHSEVALELQYAAIPSYQDAFRGFIEAPAPGCFDFPSVDLMSENPHKLSQICLLTRPPVFTVPMGHVKIRSTKHPAPYLQQLSDDAYSAIYASIYIDKMSGLRGGICERCSKVFLIRSDRPVRFCSPKCGDASRQARYRASPKSVAPEVDNG